MIKLPDWFNSVKSGRTNFEDFNSVPKAEDLAEGAIECTYEHEGNYHIGKLRSVDTEGEGFMVESEEHGIYWTKKALIRESDSISLHPYPTEEEASVCEPGACAECGRRWEVDDEGVRFGELVMYLHLAPSGKPVARLKHGRALLMESNMIPLVEATACAMYRTIDAEGGEIGDLYDPETVPDIDDELPDES